MVSLRQAGLDGLARIELLNATMVAATNQQFEMQLPETDIFFVEFLGVSQHTIFHMLDQLRRNGEISVENTVGNLRENLH